MSQVLFRFYLGHLNILCLLLFLFFVFRFFSFQPRPLFPLLGLNQLVFGLLSLCSTILLSWTLLFMSDDKSLSSFWCSETTELLSLSMVFDSFQSDCCCFSTSSFTTFVSVNFENNLWLGIIKYFVLTIAFSVSMSIFPRTFVPSLLSTALIVHLNP